MQGMMGMCSQRVETLGKIATRALWHHSIAQHSFRFESAMKGIFLHRGASFPRSRNRGLWFLSMHAFGADER